MREFCSKMHLLVWTTMILAAHAQQSSTIDPNIIDVFGTPSPTDFEKITVKPTEGTATFVDKNGENCQCVPYYLCDSMNRGVDINNKTVTGFGELDVRFGDDCQESVEICCTIPKDPDVVPTSTPKPIWEPTLPKGCGYRNSKGVSVTITGGSGKEAQFGEFPWVIALVDSRNGSLVGVGVLIHPQVVLTGAHVAYKYPLGTLKARAGEWDTQTTKEILPYQEQNVIETYLHKDFNDKSLKNDMALLRLAQPFVISEHINVICLPNQDEMFDGSQNCIANGWGKDVFGIQGRYAVFLKRVAVDIVPYARCNELLKKTRLGHNFNLHQSFVCAGGKEGQDTCQGDGGAPLACPIGNDRYKLTGLVAWGIGCGIKDVPGVYANVPMFRTWLEKKMAEWQYDISGSVI